MTKALHQLNVTGLALVLDGQPLLQDVSFSLQTAQTLSVVGRSGSGKTSLLRALAGLLPLAAGRIELDGRAVNHLPAAARGIVYMGQEALLFPHLDVFENIAFGLRMRRQPEAQVRSAVAQLLAQLELEGLARRRPETLSGGQRQRVAFGRALIVAPPLLLLDEPFSSLDPGTRAAMQALVRRQIQAHGVRALLVTHDVKEALLLGDRLALLADGRLRHYADRAAFCADPATGAAQEAAFWRALEGGARP